MGIGIARLLKAHNYSVLTSLQNRSEATKTRASKFDIHCVETDKELLEASDVVLSIVPPEHAHKTAVRIADALKSANRKRDASLYLLDLNAISPQKARETAEAVAAIDAGLKFIDGGIIGGPPSEKDDKTWKCPSLVVSGPHLLSDLENDGARLTKILNIKHVGDDIGKATGLKMCFASMTKGLTAIGIMAFTTAQKLGVHDELKEHLEQYSPKTGELVNGGLIGMPPKAYRWIAEMQMIGETFGDAGFDPALFPFAGVYDIVANQTELGKEQTDSRQRGKTTEDVATLMLEGLRKR
jgi:3-hydroxyisobutyrate dehydrogenase-like beta-hydroxyacid dehydrogenase